MYQLTDYNYHLPDELIAQKPEKERDASRLLTLDRKKGDLDFCPFETIVDFLNPGDLLVVNNTKVIPGRIYGRKESGGKIEILILDYYKGMKQKDESGHYTFECLIKASKRPRTGSYLHFNDNLTAEVLGFESGIYSIRFLTEDDLEKVIHRIGKMPLPPYIKRDPDSDPHEDRERYQTIYASKKGAVAAPTAGLHFTENLMDSIKKKQVGIAELTLHVGYGTFVPVRVNDIREHKMHAEWFSLSAKTASLINQTKKNGGRVVAVGTTSVRTLEYVANTHGEIKECAGDCDMFIYPGYEFHVVDAMITNFHLPESTLLMLISAFAGREHVMNAYKQAIEKKYRFFSYGDAMFIH